MTAEQLLEIAFVMRDAQVSFYGARDSAKLAYMKAVQSTFDKASREYETQNG